MTPFADIAYFFELKKTFVKSYVLVQVRRNINELYSSAYAYLFLHTFSGQRWMGAIGLSAVESPAGSGLRRVSTEFRLYHTGSHLPGTERGTCGP